MTDPRLPQHDDPYADGEPVDRRPLPERSPRILLWLAAGLALLALAIIVAVVVSRPPSVGSPASSEVVRPSGSSAASLLPGTPPGSAGRAASREPAAVVEDTPPATSLTGLASFVDPSFGRRYLALPSGPGHLARICSRIHRCVWRRSTDAGPSLQRQREGRIADVSYGDFRWLCACDPWAVGILPVVVSR